jgi:hypothetical protein
MTIELTREQEEELEMALSSYLSDLRMEIADTDSYDFRQALKQRKTLLNQVLERLTAAQGQAGTPGVEMGSVREG